MNRFRVDILDLDKVGIANMWQITQRTCLLMFIKSMWNCPTFYH